jgi:hypothetical protein
MAIVASLLTFPNISWWMQVVRADKLILDKGAHFQKMTWRNRYKISGANNNIMLSVPIENGRNQRLSISEIKIFNEERWQTQHWRTLVSVYNRSPFFNHYEPTLRPLFEQRFTHLADFNLAGIEWVKTRLKLKFEIELTAIYQKDYPDAKDIRDHKNATIELPKYYQVFEERAGFVPDLSILDLLFSEGPAAMRLLLD